MSGDNLSPLALEGRTYSYGSAPVGNFQTVIRNPPERSLEDRIADMEQRLAECKADGGSEYAIHWFTYEIETLKGQFYRGEGRVGL